MATTEQIHLLLSELGPALQPLSVEGMPEEKLWGVMLDEDLSVLIDFDEQRNVIVLECEVSSLPEGDLAGHYEIMLSYNYLWPQTGGTRFSLAQPGGKIMQLLDISADGLTPHTLSDIITGFGDEARVWRSTLGQPVISDEMLETSQDFIVRA